MRIVRAQDFRMKMANYVKDLPNDKIIFIANETYADRSFLVVHTDMFMHLEHVQDAIEAVKKRVSDKYKLINEKRKY